MTEDEKSELIARMNGLQNLLEQKDYSARKVAFEVARLYKESHPEAITPALDKYIEGEKLADEWRDEITEIRKKLEEDV